MEKQDIIEAQIRALTLYDANNTCLTVEQCATFLSVHRHTVTSRIHSGKIKANFIGRVWRIPKLQFVKEILEKL